MFASPLFHILDDNDDDDGDDDDDDDDDPTKNHSASKFSGEIRRDFRCSRPRGFVMLRVGTAVRIHTSSYWISMVME